MKLLTSEAAAKLQVILSKRAGRKLTQEELEQAYDALMGFAEALIELDEPKDDPESNKQIHMKPNFPIAINNHETL